MRNNTYFKFSFFLCVLAAITGAAKMHTFSWGAAPFLSNGASINDLWYYNMEGISIALITSSLASLSIYLMQINPTSLVCWAFKYTAILLALISSCRAAFHIVTYDKVCIFEMLADLFFVVFVIGRAIIWHRKYIKNHEHRTTRSALEGH